MKKVAEEWRTTWTKVQLDYNKEVSEILQGSCDFLRLLKRYIKRGQLVLEAGCGYGSKCVLFSKYFNVNVVGIDIVLNPLETLMDYLSKNPHALNLKILLVNADVAKLPLRDGIFDVITSFGVIEHFRNESDVILALSEAYRVLKVGGHLIVIIPNFAATFRNKLVIALTKNIFGMYHKPYTRSMLVKYLKNIERMQIVEEGFLSFGFRSLIQDIVKKRSIEKIIYFLYHAMWSILNFMLKIVGDDYQNLIYIVVKKVC
jgi:ubiquinone/menaquinone biosynthesis C-methylase UbiE